MSIHLDTGGRRAACHSWRPRPTWEMVTDRRSVTCRRCLKLAGEPGPDLPPEPPPLLEPIPPALGTHQVPSGPRPAPRRDLILDIETIPAGAREHRALCQAHGLDWRAIPPEHAMVAAPVEPPQLKPIRSGLKTAAVIAEHEAARREEYAAELAAYPARQWEAAMAWWREGSLRPSRGEVHCAAWVCGDEVACTTADDERGTLVEVEAAIRRLNPRRIIAWNGGFDFGFLFGRAMRLGLPSLAGLVADPHYSAIPKMGLRNRVPVLVDAAQLWPLPTRMAGEGKLITACEALGIDHGEANPIDGSQVLDAYLDGRDDEIRAHCTADVRDLDRVWRVLKEVYNIDGRKPQERE